jgi:GT2 family glycosyltransferase
MDPLIVVPYTDLSDIQALKTALGYKLPVVFWEDKYKIGSDLAYQTLWNIHKYKDIIILHSDMLPLPTDTSNSWYYELLEHVKNHPEAGIFGTTLLYPAKSADNKYYIQHAGGKFVNGEAVHFGGGLELNSRRASRELEEDKGQYDYLREVAWVTFGGVYLRRSVIAAVGNFNPSYYWTYYRDVDYCLSARKLGFKIYQTPVKLLHYEGKDNKRIQKLDPVKNEHWSINFSIFKEKWGSSDLYNTLDRAV